MGKHVGTAIALVTMLIQGCGDDEPKDTCTIGTTEGCMENQVCEPVMGGEPACFAPLEVQGRVFDATNEAGIAGANVVALDSNGGARSSNVVSGAEGAYTLPISVPRDSNGVPAQESITLRVGARDFQAFPTLPRTALPIALGEAVMQDGKWVVKNASTDVSLFPLGGDSSQRFTVAGRVDHTEAGGVLVIAVQGGVAVASAVTDDEGNFRLFNVPTGEISIEGYRAGVRITSSVTTISGNEDGVVLVASTEGLGRVTGSVNIVNAGSSAGVTSVILVVESTFVENAARGESPSGLRATDVTNAFAIENVPPGEYVVLAAFENDGLVRDPDTEIGGTQIARITVPEGGGNVTLDQSFKITGALAVMSPGAESVDVVSDAHPTFVWADDSSEDGYELRVYDAFGNIVHENTEIDRVTGEGTVSYPWTDATLSPGMLYQFRAWSFKVENGVRHYISSTEDLRGVFEYQPAQ